MPEPTATLAGSAFYKVLVYFFGPVLATVVVMIMTPPQNKREFVVSFISTIFCSLGVGSYLVSHFFGVTGVDTELNAMLAGGVFFVSGLPGWFAVRALFLTMERNKGKDLISVVQDVQDDLTNKPNDKQQ